jgi:hypothetical protein
MASGVAWTDIPVPGNLTGMVLTNITLDPFVDINELDSDAIILKVVDLAGHFWIVEIEFEYSSNKRKIKDIYIRSMTGRSKAKDAYLNTFDNFNTTTRIDIFNQSNYQIDSGTGGAYQNSLMGSPNTLISVLIGDLNSPYAKGGDAMSPLITYRLIIE